MSNHQMPVAVHVARREAKGIIERGRLSLARWDGFLDTLMRSVMGRYGEGRKLSREDYLSLVRDVRDTLGTLSPVRMHEASQAPTRIHPKGEAHEFLALVPYGNDLSWNARAGFLGLRVHVTRKRVVVDQEFVGLDVTRHALERARERPRALGPDRIAKVEDVVASLAGMVVVWRWAMVRERGGAQAAGPVGEQVALPFGNGLLLGRIERIPSERLNLTYRLDRYGVACMERTQNDLQSSRDADGEWFMPFLGSTVIDDDLMSMAQIDLRDALARFSDRNADILADLGRYASWAAPEMHDRETFFDLKDRLDVLAAELEAILAHPAHRGALQSREQFAVSGRFAYPEAVMADPRPRLARLFADMRWAA